MGRAERDREFLNASRVDNSGLRVDFKRRVLRLFRLQSRELELVWVALLIERLILGDANVESVILGLVKIRLVEHFPVNLQRANTSVLDFESLADGWDESLGGGVPTLSSCGSICDDGWHGKRRGHRVVVQANLVVRNYARTSRDINADWELDCGQAFDICHNIVIEFAANIIVDSQGDRYFGIRQELASLRSENKCDTLIIGQEESLLLLVCLCLSECVAGDGGEFLSLFMLITENGLCTPLCRVLEATCVRFDRSSEPDLFAAALLASHAFFKSLLLGLIFKALLFLLKGQHDF